MACISAYSPTRDTFTASGDGDAPTYSRAGARNGVGMHSFRRLTSGPISPRSRNGPERLRLGPRSDPLPHRLRRRRESVRAGSVPLRALPSPARSAHSADRVDSLGTFDDRTWGISEIDDSLTCTLAKVNGAFGGVASPFSADLVQAQEAPW